MKTFKEDFVVIFDDRMDRLKRRAELASGKLLPDMVLTNCKVINVFNLIKMFDWGYLTLQVKVWDRTEHQPDALVLFFNKLKN